LKSKSGGNLELLSVGQGFHDLDISLKGHKGPTKGLLASGPKGLNQFIILLYYVPVWFLPWWQVLNTCTHRHTLAFISSSCWKGVLIDPQKWKLLGVTCSLNNEWARHLQQYTGKLLMAFLCPFLNHCKTLTAYHYYTILQCIKEVEVCQLVQTHQ
jgi:hypothetical protein